MNLQEMIMSYLFNEENKEKIIKELNSSVDIPIIKEDTEESSQRFTECSKM